MIVAVPCIIPVTVPETGSTEAIVVAVLVQVPPVEVLANKVVPPTHTVGVPVIAAGGALTVTVAVAVPQPLE